VTTDTRTGLPRDGYTLVEVMVAMVILAIGVLLLQAGAIAAARAVVFADKQTDYAMAAASSMEKLRYDVLVPPGGIGTATRSTNIAVGGGRDSATVVDSVTYVAARKRLLVVRVNPRGSRTYARPPSLRITAYLYDTRLN
jgi:prepilin-type N-terminal cleavage/methylation domain-containing protein